jgi:hypothetical protein
MAHVCKRGCDWPRPLMVTTRQQCSLQLKGRSQRLHQDMMRIARVARYGCVGINLTTAYTCCWAKA